MKFQKSALSRELIWINSCKTIVSHELIRIKTFWDWVESNTENLSRTYVWYLHTPYMKLQALKRRIFFLYPTGQLWNYRQGHRFEILGSQHRVEGSQFQIGHLRTRNEDNSIMSCFSIQWSDSEPDVRIGKKGGEIVRREKGPVLDGWSQRFLGDNSPKNENLGCPLGG